MSPLGVDPEGRRCEARGFLELDHQEGFARTHEHRVGSTRFLCRPHNQHAADVLFTPSGGVMHPGKDWMDRKRREVRRRED